MASMHFDDAAADRLEAAYLGADVVAQRADTMRRLKISPGEHILDIGSGPGFLAKEMAKATGENGSVLGVDISEQFVARATARNEMSWLSYQVGDATNLPCEPESIDLAVSTQVAEYVPDIVKFCQEFARVLRPGGRGLIIATDWDAVCWNSIDPDLTARVMAAFAPHCADIRLPRTLAPRLRNAGLTVDNVGYFPIINLTRFEGSYSATMTEFVTGYIREQGTLSEEDLNRWVSDLKDLDARGEYFFSTGRFCFEVSKPA